jgi:hypothetical protein
MEFMFIYQKHTQHPLVDVVVYLPFLICSRARPVGGWRNKEYREKLMKKEEEKIGKSIFFLPVVLSICVLSTSPLPSAGRIRSSAIADWKLIAKAIEPGHGYWI